MLLLAGCARTSAEPNRHAEPRLEESAPGDAPGSCEGLDEDACRATAGCDVGEGQEIKTVGDGYCLADPSVAGCKTEDDSGVLLPAGAPNCSPDGRQFYFGRVQDTPDGWNQDFCGDLVDPLEIPRCPGSKPRVMTAEERTLREQQLAGEALGAYEATLAAYRRGDHKEYFDGFASELTCFYAQTKNGRRALERARRKAMGRAEVYLTQTHVVRASADEVVFIDYGFHSRVFDEDSIPERARNYIAASDDPIEQGIHAKLIAMSKEDGTWKITAETSRAHQDCIQPGAFSGVAKPRRVVECEAKHQAALEHCDVLCGSSTTGHACFSCPDEAWCELKSCSWIKSLPGETCG